ncbi:MAG: amino acid adenylation domain-containing protein [Bacteroidota bacterium]
MSSQSQKYKKLTRSQELLWLGEEVWGGTPINNMAFIIRWNRPMQVESFLQSFSVLVDTCDSMRMVFRTTDDGKISPMVLPTYEYELPFEDISQDTVRRENIQKELTARSQSLFDFSNSLFDAALFKLGSEDYLLYFNQHHLITDGWGMANQLKWLESDYQHRLDHRVESPEALPPFLHAIKRITEEKEKIDESDLDLKISIPPLLFGQINQDLSPFSQRVIHQLPTETSTLLQHLIQSPEVRCWTDDLTRFTIFATAIFAHLHRITGEVSLCLGVPAHNRISAADRACPGIFMELFPLEVELSPSDSYADLLTKVQQATMVFLRESKRGHSSSQSSRRFNTIFNYLNVAFTDTSTDNSMVEWLHSGYMEPNHHLRFQVYDLNSSGQLTVCFDINETVIPQSPELFQKEFLEIFDLTIRESNKKVSEASSKAIERALEFETTDSSYPFEKTVVDLFYQQAEQRPDAIAVEAPKGKLTYRELDRRSNQLANLLLSKGLKSEDRVAIMVDRGLEMIVGLWGIVKAGGAYVPIDPEYPAERIEFMAQDAGVKYIVTQSVYSGLLLGGQQPIILSSTFNELDSVDDFRPAFKPKPSDLAYVLYTSGSTGKPKGAMNQHDGLINSLSWMQQALKMEPENGAILQKTTFCFDVSIWELFWPLMIGARLVMAEKGGEKDSSYLRRLIDEYNISMIHFVPPMLDAFLLQNNSSLPSLKKVLCIGESLLLDTARKFESLYPNVELHNLYGPTEAAIQVTHIEIKEASRLEKITIGKSIANSPIFVVNKHRQICPIGVPGELWIGGIQVCRGYLNREELTKEKFVNIDLIHEGTVQRYYRTGDLVSRNENGEIDFLGRFDHQLKLRGYRIELGEIESALKSISGINRAVVVAKEISPDNKQLVGYLETEEEIDIKSIKSFLESKLPHYMVPAFLLRLGSLPLLPNGKIDRKSLPHPGNKNTNADQSKPNGEFEELVHSHWCNLFNAESIDTKSSFFSMGGHSLMAIKLVNNINDDLNIDMPPHMVFQFPTISEQAKALELKISELLAQENT